MIIIWLKKFKFKLKINEKLAKYVKKKAGKQVFLRFYGQSNDDSNTILH